MSEQLSYSSEPPNMEKEEENEENKESKENSENSEKEEEYEENKMNKEISVSQDDNNSLNNNNKENSIQLNQPKEDKNSNKSKKNQKLMVMVIPKTNKNLPLPLNTLYFFLELFAYENGIKQLTDEDNKLVFYLMNINWLNELKIFYNYKCIEFIIKKELKENKNFLNKINDLLNITNPSKLYEDYKLINKFNNIIINPKKIKKSFVDQEEELFAPKKIEYDTININKNIASSNLDFLEYFTYYPKCVLINERMRNILYLEYKYLKFSQFQKGDITLVNDKIFIKLTSKIIEVCSFERKNLKITPLYILYYFDISNVPFWENVLYDKKDFKKEYLLKRIHKDNKHIRCMLDPFNKEYIGYSINLNIPYAGEPIKEYNFINENISNIDNLPTENELQNSVETIGKYNMNGYYNNKFEENHKKNKEDDSENQFMLKMKLLRKKKQEEIINKKKKYIETLNKFSETKTDESGFVNVNGEIIGYIQGDDLTKNGEGFLGSTGSDFMSSNDDNTKNKKLDLNNNEDNIKNKNSNKNKNNKIKNNEMDKIKEEGIEESEDDYNGEILVERGINKKNININKNNYNKNYNDNNYYNENEEENDEYIDKQTVDDKKKDCFIF